MFSSVESKSAGSHEKKPDIVDASAGRKRTATTAFGSSGLQSALIKRNRKLAISKLPFYEYNIIKAEEVKSGRRRVIPQGFCCCERPGASNNKKLIDTYNEKISEWGIKNLYAIEILKSAKKGPLKPGFVKTKPIKKIIYFSSLPNERAAALDYEINITKLKECIEQERKNQFYQRHPEFKQSQAAASTGGAGSGSGAGSSHFQSQQQQLQQQYLQHLLQQVNQELLSRQHQEQLQLQVQQQHQVQQQSQQQQLQQWEQLRLQQQEHQEEQLRLQREEHQQMQQQQMLQKLHPPELEQKQQQQRIMGDLESNLAAARPLSSTASAYSSLGFSAFNFDTEIDELSQAQLVSVPLSQVVTTNAEPERVEDLSETNLVEFDLDPYPFEPKFR